MSLTLTTAPAVEPVTLAEMKLQCGFGPMEDSDHLRSEELAEQLRDAIQTARQHVENELARALITQTWTYTLQRFPAGGREFHSPTGFDIEIPMPKFQELTAFTYLDTSGTSQNMLATGSWGYQLVSGGDTTPAKLRPPLFLFWPPTEPTAVDTVSITYTCGYGDTPQTVPRPIRSAIKIIAQHLYENRPGALPSIADLMLGSYINLVV